ncbi:MAG: Choline-glycine betaine transporter BetT [Candidatus Methanohalarchaeum thermophilum]|uniref:Choline-glycine betaine transporter BetT n=1 Tax=Methanohalarchaeum thermophilum TaxID=1903181 RepID=A0A1Q6DVP0_METT1|nr:MAG: Choline-glycine betaine transporter BetT [Candidatus Methanohalarchaeum thermophilum]
MSTSEGFMEEIDNWTFGISAAVVGLLLIWAIVDISGLASAINTAFNFVTNQLSWLYLFYVALVLIFVLFFGFSRYGKLKLGEPDSEPELNTVSWFAILFGAGMGVGLVFWGAAQPIMIWNWPAKLFAGESLSDAAAIHAMQWSFFHWGFHPWALYSMWGAILGYFSFRRGLPQLPSSTLYPILGKEGIKGPWGKAFDVVAVFATFFGLVTTLGLGSTQFTTGLSRLTNGAIGTGATTTAILIVILTAIFVTAVISGIEKGISLIGDINLYVALTLLAAVLILGPTVFLLDLGAQVTGGYLNHIIEMTFYSSPIQGDSFVGAWTVFFWAWWIAWTPFVGGFIARISKGRRLREFVVGTLVVPTILSLIWFDFIGGAGIWMQKFGGLNVVDPICSDYTSSLFVVLGNIDEIPFFGLDLPGFIGTILVITGVFLVGTFFLTSANGASWVLSQLTTGGKLDPSNKTKAFWGIGIGVIAIIFIFAGQAAETNPLEALQTASIVGCLPFLLFTFASMWSFIKEVPEDVDKLEEGEFIGKLEHDHKHGN